MKPCCSAHLNCALSVSFCSKANLPSVFSIKKCPFCIFLQKIDAEVRALEKLILQTTTYQYLFSRKVPSKRNFGQYQTFFSLLRDMICESPDGRITTAKLEEKVREWQESPASMLNPWFMAQPHNWMECVLAALKFLSGDVLGEF
jgi:hypothetical protein